MSRGEVHSPRITFELLDVALADSAPELFGIWAVVPRSDEFSAPFLAAVGAVDSPVWRANYTGDPSSAEANLAMGEARIDVSKKALDKVPERLNRFMETQAGALDFGVSAPKQISAKPEGELLALLQEIRRGGAPVSYGMGEKFFVGWEQASKQFMEVVERVCGFVACYARVETRVNEQLLGQTTVSWTGDVNTVWKAGLTPEQVRTHQRTLALALESRDTLIRTVMMAAQLAIKLSVLLSTPGGVILALPAVWRFIHQVLAESSELTE
jgi:hypothetical protein